MIKGLFFFQNQQRPRREAANTKNLSESSERRSSVGLVETFKPNYVEGWVEASNEILPVQVTLFVNEIEIANTWADEPSRHNTLRTIRGFRILMRDLWQFCKQSDKVTVRMGGEPIPIVGKGLFKVPDKNGPRDLSELETLFRNGYVFSQHGRLQRSKGLDITWQENVMALYDRIRWVLRDKLGYDAFIVYGTLLGLVRDGNFIGHDLDFDSAYLSRHTNASSAAAELRDIGLLLIENGFDVTCKRTTLHIHDLKNPRIKVDLFHLFFDENGELCFPFGVAGTKAVTKEGWRGVRDATLAGYDVCIPANGEELVEYIYGPSWRRPIAGFNWNRSREKWWRDAWTTSQQREEVYWENFYSRHSFVHPTEFCQAILKRSDIPETVLDIGCGDGRDTVAFAAAGRHAIGLDRSCVGLRHARNKAAEAGVGASCTFVTGDVSDSVQLEALFERARAIAEGGALLFYIRFLFHGLAPSLQENLMASINKRADLGDILAVEFRAKNDAKKTKSYDGHYRRFQDSAAFSRSLHDAYGFHVLEETEGTGLSPHGNEDPCLYRALAIR